MMCEIVNGRLLIFAKSITEASAAESWRDKRGEVEIVADIVSHYEDQRRDGGDGEAWADVVQAGEKRKEISDPKVAGLYLIVRPSGLKTWAIRTREDGAHKKISLGAFPDVSPEMARLAAVKTYGLKYRKDTPIF